MDFFPQLPKTLPVAGLATLNCQCLPHVDCSWDRLQPHCGPVQDKADIGDGGSYRLGSKSFQTTSVFGLIDFLSGLKLVSWVFQQNSVNCAVIQRSHAWIPPSNHEYLWAHTCRCGQTVLSSKMFECWYQNSSAEMGKTCLKDKIWEILNQSSRYGRLGTRKLLLSKRHMACA